MGTYHAGMIVSCATTQAHLVPEARRMFFLVTEACRHRRPALPGAALPLAAHDDPLHRRGDPSRIPIALALIKEMRYCCRDDPGAILKDW
jgi:hypothetical protein